MTPALVHWLQITTLFAWLAPLVLAAPAMARVALRRDNRKDVAKGDAFFMALLQILFSVRWILWPGSLQHMEINQLTFWASAYALSTALALRIAVRLWKLK